MSLAAITPQQRQLVYEDVGYEENQVQEKIRQVKEWMKKQPHLPQIPDDKIAHNLIHAFLGGTKLNTEAAKSKLDLYFSMRHELPDVFKNKDPTSKMVKDSVHFINYFPLSQLTPDGVRVNIISFNKCKERSFNMDNLRGMYRRMMAIALLRMVLLDELCRGEYLVFDCRNFHTSHLTELSWPTILKFTSLVQDGLPVRIRGVFAFNAPGYAETAANIIKPVLKEKIRNRIYIYQGDHTNLYKHIPQELLPSDYGGEAQSIFDLNWAWQNKIESLREFLIEDDKLITDEKKRPVDSISRTGQTFGISGTFTKLNID